jgi:hypothetical protein
MKPFDDRLPEEKEPQHRELATLLQRAYRRPVPVPPPEQGQIMAGVRERLMRANAGDSYHGDMPHPQTGEFDRPPRQAVSPATGPGRRMRSFRLMALLAAAVIIVVLLGTPLLLQGPRLLSAGDNTNKTPAGPPTLVLTPAVTSVGSTIQVALKNFTPSTRVALTRDMQTPIPLDGGSSMIGVDRAGSATVKVYIGSDWGIGFHTIVAEDFKTHVVASATLQIVQSATQTLPQRSLLPGNVDEQADLLSELNTSVSCVPFNLEGNMYFLERHLVSAAT